MAKGKIVIGIGGWSYAPWRGVFYPPSVTQKGELAYASRQLTSIEINSTFYGSQKPESFAKWYGETPEGFVFSLKAPRFATNRRVLAEAGESIARFFSSGVLELKEKLGPINWQFAPTKVFEPTDFEAFLKLLPQNLQGRDLRHALEVRHPSFGTAAFADLARRFGHAIVYAGDSSYPEIDEVTAPFTYARIMGTAEDETAGYAPAALDRWAAKAKGWAQGGRRDVFLYVISGFKAHNPAAARALIERIG